MEVNEDPWADPVSRPQAFMNGSRETKNNFRIKGYTVESNQRNSSKNLVENFMGVCYYFYYSD